MPMPLAILILSGGLDSTVASYMAIKESKPALGLTFDYGQRAAAREIESSKKIAGRLKVRHQVVSLPWFADLITTPLVNKDAKLPEVRHEDLDDLKKGLKSADQVWVPNRNGLFLNIAAAFAEAANAPNTAVLVTGFNAEEGITFPDNSAPFVRAADEFFWYSTRKKVRILTPTLRFTKGEIAKKGMEMDVPFQDLWFCYEGGQVPCRRCESCLRDFRALQEAGVPDPWRP